jgi:hypothetical protein
LAFDPKRREVIGDSLDEVGRLLYELTDNKIRSKEILRDAGFNVPEGIYLDTASHDTVEERIDRFLEEHPDLEGYVLKENTGSQGTGVIIFEAHEIAELKSWAKKLTRDGKGVLLEERIVPPPMTRGRGRKKKDFHDYNYRVITTADADDPQIIDSEIRFIQKKGRYPEPVNINQRAKASRLSALKDPELVAKIEQISKEAAKVLYRQVGGSASKSLSIFGFDLMHDKNGKIYIIEPNAGSVGGLSTLTSLDKKPLAAIGNVLVPHIAKVLEEQFQERLDLSVDVSMEDLVRLPSTRLDDWNRYYTFSSSGQYKKAEKILLSLSQEFDSSPNFEYALNRLIAIAAKTKDFDTVTQFLEEANTRGLTRKAYIDNKSVILRESQGVGAAYDFLLNEIEDPQGEEKTIFFQLFITTIHAGKDEEAVRMWQNFNGKSDGTDIIMSEIFYRYHKSHGNRLKAAEWRARIIKAKKLERGNAKTFKNALELKKQQLSTQREARRVRAEILDERMVKRDDGEIVFDYRMSRMAQEDGDTASKDPLDLAS